MKKLIATLATLAAIGFCLALAAHDDPSGTYGKRYSEWTGMTGSQNTAKTNVCVNEKGKTFKPGSMGYADCLKETRRLREQQAGQVPDFRDSDVMSHKEDTENREPIEPDYPY